MKILNQPVDRATSHKIRAEARAIASESASREIETLRRILDDFRTDDARKSEHINELERRIDRLEERERHMLTRAAIHEAWDQLAFQFIAGHDASFPEPPPLTLNPKPARSQPGLPGGSDD